MREPEQDSPAPWPGEVPPLPSWALWTGAVGWWLTDALVGVSQLRLLQRMGELEAADGPMWRMTLASALLWVPFTVLCLRLSERVPLGGERKARAAAAHLGGLALLAMAEAPLRRLPVKEDGRIRFLDCAAITHVEAEANYVRVHTGGGQHVMRETLTRLEERLDAADGETLLFASIGREDGQGYGDLYAAERVRGRWQPARNLGPTVNTSQDEYHPSLSPDERTLYFVRHQYEPEYLPADLFHVRARGLLRPDAPRASDEDTDE